MSKKILVHLSFNESHVKFKKHSQKPRKIWGIFTMNKEIREINKVLFAQYKKSFKDFLDIDL